MESSRSGHGSRSPSGWRYLALWPVVMVVALACGESQERAPSASTGAFTADEEIGRTAAPTDPGTSPPAPAPDRREGQLNVVILTLDTARADAFGTYGQELPSSPWIDRLAREGVVFERVATSSPNTLPSHATLFTGKQPYAHGARSNLEYRLAEENVTLAEVLAAQGFRTGAEIGAAALRGQTRIAQGFEHVRDTEDADAELLEVSMGGGGEQTEFPYRLGTDITRRGVEFIREHRSEPFLLWLHYFDIHVPYVAPPMFSERFPDNDYLAGVAFVDELVGQVIREIERLGLREQTLVVVTSDHGEGLGEHGEGTHSYFVYQSTIRVPLIFWGPSRLPAGLRVPSLVRLVDVTPTILDLLELPELEGVQGVSLKGLLETGATGLELPVYGESIEFSRIYGDSPIRFMREGDWKYIHKVNPELYDLESDPRELNNLATKHPDVVRQLRDRLARELKVAAGAPTGSRTAVDDRTRRALAALGYLDMGIQNNETVDLDSLELSGFDPNDRIIDMTEMSRVETMIKNKNFVDAVRILQALQSRNPESAYIAGLLGAVLLKLERLDESVGAYRRATELEATNYAYHHDYAKVQFLIGDEEGGIHSQQTMLTIEPCHETRVRLIGRFREAGRHAEMVETMADGVARCPEQTSLANNYAWALATLPESELRNGAEAVIVAEAAVGRLPGEPGPEYLDTLAAAYAEVGDFDAALRQVDLALVKLEAMGVPEQVLVEVRSHRDSFLAMKPIRDP